MLSLFCAKYNLTEMSQAPPKPPPPTVNESSRSSGFFAFDALARTVARRLGSRARDCLAVTLWDEERTKDMAVK